MNLENSIVIATYEDPAIGELVWTKVTAVWGGSVLTVMQQTEGGGVEILETFSGADHYGARSGKHSFSGHDQMVDGDGDVVSKVTALPQGPGCRPCGT